MAEWIFLLAYCIGCTVIAVRRQHVQGRPGPGGPARRPGWGILLLPLALMLRVTTGGGALTLLLVLASGALVALAPQATRRVFPYALIGLGLVGLKEVLLSGAAGYSTAFGGDLYGGGAWRDHLLLPEALLFLAAGSYLAIRWGRATPRLTLLVAGRPAGGRGRPGGGSAPRPPWNLLLIPVAGLLAELAQPAWAFGFNGGADLVMVAVVGLLTVAVVLLLPSVAADLAVGGLLALGVYGVATALLWPQIFPRDQDLLYGAVYVTSRPLAVLAGLQGLALIGLALWLAPRALDKRTMALLWPQRASEAELAGRVEQLTQTRAEAVDTAAAELRRVERDLHDGAQARLVAVGMNLRAAQKLITSSPEAASQLLAEAIDSSSRALTELRNLVRGIHPPVLADRGLPDAIRALALDTPLHTETDIELAGRPEPPVESACYFAVAEALANAVKHAGARHVQIHARHDGTMLRIEVTDDGSGGADPAHGTGLRGLERRLATFDGILAVSSPPGGPTLIVIEVPCALSSPKISSS
ncbi:MAG TPA: histidine kinase [Streptosporangiaceae bacterium]